MGTALLSVLCAGKRSRDNGDTETGRLTDENILTVTKGLPNVSPLFVFTFVGTDQTLNHAKR